MTPPPAHAGLLDAPPLVGLSLRAEAAPSSIAARGFDAPALTPAERCFDVAITLLLLPFALLVGGVLALIVFADSPGPVFYRCTRVGQGGRRFEMLKFRKMRRHASGELLTVADDERFTPIGRFLALTKLDELPQLWNVLKGDMRLVGPRPEVEPFVARYARAYDEILTVVPGITGPAAVEFANESALLAGRDDVAEFYCSDLLPHKIAVDIDYIRSRSMRGDLTLLVRTLATPLRRMVHGVLRFRQSPRGVLYRHAAWGVAGLAIAVAFAVVSPV